MCYKSLSVCSCYFSFLLSFYLASVLVSACRVSAQLFTWFISLCAPHTAHPPHQSLSHYPFCAQFSALSCIYVYQIPGLPIPTIILEYELLGENTWSVLLANLFSALIIVPGIWEVTISICWMNGWNNFFKDLFERDRNRETERES